MYPYNLTPLVVNQLNHNRMQYLLDIPKEQDWRLLSPLLERLKIRYKAVDESTPTAKEEKIFALVKMYEMGKISSGKASEILGMTRTEFLEMLGKYQVSFFGQTSTSEIERDFENAWSDHCFKYDAPSFPECILKTLPPEWWKPLTTQALRDTKKH